MITPSPQTKEKRGIASARRRRHLLLLVTDYQRLQSKYPWDEGPDYFVFAGEPGSINTHRYDTAFHAGCSVFSMQARCAPKWIRLASSFEFTVKQYWRPHGNLSLVSAKSGPTPREQNFSTWGVVRFCLRALTRTANSVDLPAA